MKLCQYGEPIQERNESKHEDFEPVKQEFTQVSEPIQSNSDSLRIRVPCLAQCSTKIHLAFSFVF